MKETLGNCIIPAVTLAAHTAREAVSFKERLKDIARILTSTVKMAQRVSHTTSRGNGHMKRITHKLARHSRAERPANYSTTKQVDYYR
jgi:hypothetical protein